MFGLELIKHKRKLTQNFSFCFSIIHDSLGNVPATIQNDAFVNGAIVGICEDYLQKKGIEKVSSKALIIDAVFEEIYRRESVNVQTQVDEWIKQKDMVFLRGNQQANDYNNHDEKLKWLSFYTEQNFARENNLML
tara:strand:- start:6 stop:410 length:405 start_codon:yes stop_codon:yes gene_type:complete